MKRLSSKTAIGAACTTVVLAIGGWIIKDPAKALDFSQKAIEIIFPPDVRVGVTVGHLGYGGCDLLPNTARVVATADTGVSFRSEALSACRTSLQFPKRLKGNVTLELVDAGPYSLSIPNPPHDLEKVGPEGWTVSYTDSPGSYVKIALMKFAGTCANLDARIGTFKQELGENLRGLPGDILRSLNEGQTADDYAYLQNLSVIGVDQPAGSLADLRATSARYSALEVLSGACMLGASGEILHSEVFAERYFLPPLTPILKIDLRGKPNEGWPLKNLHMAAILYSLAEDAKLRNKSAMFYRPFLLRALNNVTAADVGTSADARALCLAIDKELQQTLPNLAEHALCH